MSTVTDATTVAPDIKLDRFERLATSAANAEIWARLAAAEPDLAGIYVYPVSDLNGGVTVKLQCADGEQLARSVRYLKRHHGTVTKGADDSFVCCRAKSACFDFEAYAYREEVCELVEVGTETVVSTAVSCIHCGVGIRHHVDGWMHVDADGIEYVHCGTTVDDDGNEVGGNEATPPSFNEATTVTRPVTEWRCAPILADANAPDGELS